MLGWTSLPFARLIRQRTLVVHGEADWLVPPFNARLLARILPHAQLHLVPDGHLALITSAEEIAPCHRGLPGRQLKTPLKKEFP